MRDIPILAYPQIAYLRIAYPQIAYLWIAYPQIAYLWIAYPQIAYLWIAYLQIDSVHHQQIVRPAAQPAAQKRQHELPNSIAIRQFKRHLAELSL